MIDKEDHGRSAFLEEMIMNHVNVVNFLFFDALLTHCGDTDHQ